MPKFDGTGPEGKGPTGFGRGSCGRGFQKGFGKGCGRGFGFRFAGRTPFSAPVELSKEEKIKILKAEKEDIEKELAELEK